MENSKSRSISLEIFQKVDPEYWNSVIGKLPNSSILQSWQWGINKSNYGWISNYLIWKEKTTIKAAAMLLVRGQNYRQIKTNLRIIYIPNGPLLDWNDDVLYQQVLSDIQDYTRELKAIFVKIDPQIIKSFGYEKQADYSLVQQADSILGFLSAKGWKFSQQQIQFKNTFLIGLQPPEDAILAAMKQKTRYNIRLAVKKKVNVRCLALTELEKLYAMYLETSMRDGFIIRPKEYYLNLWGSFMQANMATALIAEVENEPVAGLILFHFHKRSYYFYGMSTEKHRDKMPNHLLQWEAIKISKSLGCQHYDFWGAPNEFDESDPMWGVYKFKEGFGGEVVQTIGAYDYPSSRFKYKIIQNVLPKILSVKRIIRRKQIRQEIDL